MTWLLIVFGMAGPALVGEFATEEECDQGAQKIFAMLHEEHKGDDKFKVPPIACAGIPDAFPEPGSGQRI
jgi:hypothetical protein